MTLLFTSLLLGDATKQGWAVAKLKLPPTRGSLSPPPVAEYQTSQPRALPKRQLHEIYAQLTLTELTSLSLEPSIDQGIDEEARDKSGEVRNPASKQVKQKP
ncbi:hypothetical protein [Paraburkholderia caffeinilytica]|uniref:Uncharacterized protein n=1 Tax=Paraburkholderia caffeinilytica TaxID=1761016 RepID=A0ABQ1M665_9BURK|nr:hypothetical protein [Paraburkholderia caffeinilytica]GGC35612.1 hypothetical protein GCM10011400_22830 [Paraburkholderia caffeinilytica]CAB3794375.1 hypothetical protein LMG28690_03918 [Paraburkholderia caffeinilytica]